MLAKLVAAAVVTMAIVSDAQASDRQPAHVTAVAWRGGYRYQRFSYAPAPARTSSNYRSSGGWSSGGRSSRGRSSPLDYPGYTQPWASRTHQWNKYPNQPYYLRGERKSLLILP
jgi:hypothetical protein